MTSVQEGARVEMLAAAHLTGLGALVSVPWGHAQKYDLVADVDGALFRIQVKKAWYQQSRDRYMVNVDRVETYYSDGRMRQRKSPCDAEGFDFMAIQAGEFWYILPALLLLGRVCLTFRPPSCRSAKSSGRRAPFDVERHRDAWSLVLEGGQ